MLLYICKGEIIREQITPKGDGNFLAVVLFAYLQIIREQITPKGDGNYQAVS